MRRTKSERFDQDPNRLAGIARRTGRLVDEFARTTLSGSQPAIRFIGRNRLSWNAKRHERFASGQIRARLVFTVYGKVFEAIFGFHDRLNRRTTTRLCPLNPEGDCKTYFSALFQVFDWFPFCNSPIKGQSLEQFLFFRGRIFLKKRVKNQETATTC